MDKTVMVLFILCGISDIQAEGHTLDVCATCHANATCEDKPDGSGKVCNCKYGFVGNGRTFCQDKDECQIGTSKICGQHTTCHNTYGSYYCRCLSGYSPSNNMSVFIPNDGTQCQDIDECRTSGLCGRGAVCRNLDGTFECSCQPGYRVHNGTEPFHPHRDAASCEVIDCGRPLPAGDTVLLSIAGTTYGSVAVFGCDEGFSWTGGDSASVCGGDGLWTRPTVLCEEVDCGPPPDLPHSHTLWNQTSKVGAEATYRCNSGYQNVGRSSVSVCTAAGRWEGPSVLCKEIKCGTPPLIEATEQVWNGSATPGSTVLYTCTEGFYSEGGLDLSLCNENGQWTLPTISCKETLCGDPPMPPHAVRVWNGSSTPGSTVTYYCKIGFYPTNGNDTSVCTIKGSWTTPNISCKEVDCGVPPVIPHAVMLWDQTSTVGSQVVYRCESGFHSVGDGNVSFCTESGRWDGASLLCQEIKCQEPVFKPHAKTLWDGTLHVGSVVYYRCDEGYFTRGHTNSSVCTKNGLWEETDLWCKEISCGAPLTPRHTNLLWDGTSRPGSVALYECVDGFYPHSGDSISTCLISGEWEKASVRCKAKCGPVPLLPNAEVVWENSSIVIHRCVDGYHSWRGNNASVCSSAGMWQKATLRCIEIKPAVDHVFVLNESCVQWKAEKYEEDTEVYQVTYFGSRDFQRSFRDKRKRLLSSKADQLQLCLKLLPATNYSISITAVSARFTATVTTNTSLTGTAPPAPVVLYTEFESPVPTLRLHRSANTLDPISIYQVLVLPVERILVFDCSSPASPQTVSKSPLKYLRAQIQVRHIGTEMNFTVGDGLYYGGVFNAPLKNGRNYYIVLRTVSQWKSDIKSSCVLWAKIRGTNYVLKVSALSAAASVGLVASVVLGGYTYTWFFKKT